MGKVSAQMGKLITIEPPIEPMGPHYVRIVLRTILHYARSFSVSFRDCCAVGTSASYGATARFVFLSFTRRRMMTFRVG